MEANREPLSPAKAIEVYIKAHQLRDPQSETAALSTFYRNLEHALDERRRASSLVTYLPQADNMVDFCSNDILSFNSSGHLRAEYLAELARHPQFSTGPGSSRALYGNEPYIVQVEHEIAAFHGAETAHLQFSGYDANVTTWTAIARPGDVVLYDALVHASTHDGMNKSLATQTVEFKHNSADSFRAALLSIQSSCPQISQSRNSILVAVESVYSVHGDVCPLEEFIQIAKQLSHGKGSIQFIVDEAHGTGLLGPKGAGLVSQLGLQKEVAVTIHTYGKAMGCSGAVILGTQTIKNAILNFAPASKYSTGPSFSFVALIKASYNLLATEYALQARDQIQLLVRFFYDSLTTHPLWDVAVKSGLLSVPLAYGRQTRPLMMHIVRIVTSPRHCYWLFFQLYLASYTVWPMSDGNMRIVIHAKNTQSEIQGLIDGIFKWVEEMMSRDEGEEDEATEAARTGYNLMKQLGVSGYGIPGSEY